MSERKHAKQDASIALLQAIEQDEQRSTPSEVLNKQPIFGAYQYIPMRDPSSQTRLLKYRPYAGFDGLSFHVSWWSMKDAPRYNAISYTWGEESSITIFVNGMFISIWQNCYDALHQALGFDEGAYIWIDSICINQDDVREKNAQVQRMLDVYHNTENVLVCLGDHADNSELLVKNVLIVRIGRLEPLAEEFWDL
ncbi:putative heterokaryon incompatibility [Septoria linicola]|nr:putative heterokaryon incompatibility [Septoria linicola]